MQEKLKREDLRHELELKSSDRDAQMQRAFAKVLEMQQKAEDEVTALKTELEWTTRSNGDKMHVLTEQVRMCASENAYTTISTIFSFGGVIYIIYLFLAGKMEARKSSANTAA